MIIESELEYMRLLITISFHNNLGVECIESLYKCNTTICGTERFWKFNERNITGEPIVIKQPVYKYNYFRKETGEAIKYGDLTAVELRQAVKEGVVIKKKAVKKYIYMI